VSTSYELRATRQIRNIESLIREIHLIRVIRDKKIPPHLRRDRIYLILIIQVIAIPGAYAISWCSSKIGNLKTLMGLVILWIALCICAYFLPKGGVYEFYFLGAAVGFIMGGIQSLSRSTYAKLMPETRDTASFFSFYDVTEKIAAVVGIFSFGFITELTGSQRSSVLALASFFVIGLLLLFYANAVKVKKLAS